MHHKDTVTNQIPKKNILTPDTTVFCYFVNLTDDTTNCLLPSTYELRPDGTPDNSRGISYLDILQKKAAFFHRLRVPFKLAIDSTTMSQAQVENIQEICLLMDIEIVDMCGLPYHRPYSELKPIYDERCGQTKAEFVDRCKLLLLNMAGKTIQDQTYKNILVMDFDLEIQGKALYTSPEDSIAFCDSRRHSHNTSPTELENSMIFLSKDRALTPSGQDAIEMILKDDLELYLESSIASDAESKITFPERLYECYIFTRTTTVTALRVKQDFNIGPNHEYAPKGSAYPPRWMTILEDEIYDITNSGGMLIGGEYSSHNHESWKNPLTYLSFDEAMERACALALGDELETSSAVLYQQPRAISSGSPEDSPECLPEHAPPASLKKI